jgi:hypothetical protein
MADSVAFDFVCAQLEERTSFDRLEARGTVRIALKSAGLEVGTVSAPQMAVAVEKVLPGELVARGVDDADAVCAAIVRGLSEVKDADAGETPEAVFQRLGG